MKFAIVSTFLLFSSLSYSGPGFIAWGSTNSVVTAPIRENFLSGYQLGFESKLGRGSFEKYVKTYEDNSGLKTSAVGLAKKALNDGAIALIGFPGSHDALLVAKIASENSVLAISPGCNHQSLSTFGAFVHSSGHSGDYEVTSSISFIKKYFKGKGLVIVNPRAAPSANIGEIFKNKISTDADYDIVDLDIELKLTEEKIIELRKGKYRYIVLTPYPDDLGKLTNQLKELSIDVPTLAGSAWGTVDSDIMRRYVVSKRTPFYMMTSWNADSPFGKAYIKKYKLNFAKTPSADSAFGYDLGVITGTILMKTKSKLTKESFANSFRDNPCFNGLSIGKLCFSSKGGHATRPIFFLKYTKSGYVLFENASSF